jgi:hypothetical protein
LSKPLGNKLGLPQALVDAVSNDPYSKGDAEVSVTGLLKPLRCVMLERKHGDEITEDAADRLYAMYGQLIHSLLERANKDKNVTTERRLFMEIDGVKISGAMDSMDSQDGKLRDWKFVTSWKFKNGVVPTEWEQQQNAYAELLRHNGHTVKSLEIVGLLRDHSKLEAKRDAGYPQLPVAIMPIPLWPQEKALAFLRGRIAEYKKAKEILPECTPEERWAKDDVYAVMKEGRKSAVKLHDNAVTAATHATEVGGYVVKRPGEQTRCENYCSVAPFCAQFKKLKGGE